MTSSFDVAAPPLMFPLHLDIAIPLLPLLQCCWSFFNVDEHLWENRFWFFSNVAVTKSDTVAASNCCLWSRQQYCHIFCRRKARKNLHQKLLSPWNFVPDFFFSVNVSLNCLWSRQQYCHIFGRRKARKNISKAPNLICFACHLTDREDHSSYLWSQQQYHLTKTDFFPFYPCSEFNTFWAKFKSTDFH